MTYKQAKNDEKKNILITQRLFRKVGEKREEIHIQKENTMTYSCCEPLKEEKFFPEFLNRKVYTSKY